MTCGGNFSQTVFDNLERKKQELKKASLRGRRLMRVFAKQLLLQDKQQEEIERKLNEISRRQDKMLDRESRALGEMEELAPSPNEADQEVMGFEDEFFLFDDPARLDSEMVLDADTGRGVVWPSHGSVGGVGPVDWDHVLGSLEGVSVPPDSGDGTRTGV